MKFIIFAQCNNEERAQASQKKEKKKIVRHTKPAKENHKLREKL